MCLLTFFFSSGTYEIQPAEGVQFGTKIVIYLKSDCREYADEDTIMKVIKKYSNFVGSSLYVNGKVANVVKPLWFSDTKSITVQEHNDFYRSIISIFEKKKHVK